MRILLRVLTSLLGLAIALAGGLLALEVGWAWVQPSHGPLLVDWPAAQRKLADLNWQSTPVRLVAGGLVLAGLVLLVFAIAARRTDVRLRDPAPGVSVTTSPRSVARVVGTHVRGQDNVTGATVTATRRYIKVRAASRLESEEQLRPRLTEALTAMVGELPLARRPKVSVIVNSPRDRR